MTKGRLHQLLSDCSLSGHAYLHVRTAGNSQFLVELEDLAVISPDDEQLTFV